MKKMREERRKKTMVSVLMIAGEMVSKQQIANAAGKQKGQKGREGVSA